MFRVRRRGATIRRIAAILAALFAISSAATQAQTPSSAATPPDRAIHVTVDGVQIRQKDLSTLWTGLYVAATKHVDTVTKKPADMPAKSPYFYYAGRNAMTGRGIVWQSTATPPDTDAQRMTDEYTAAYALAAIDLGYVSEPWKSLYHTSVTDDASRLAFGEKISRALDDASDQQKNATDADIAWIRSNVAVGMSRKAIYAALRAYGLVAYNYDYAPGTPIGSGRLTGCSTDDAHNRMMAAWPYPGEPVPKRTGECATMMGPGKRKPFPSAEMNLDSAFSIACGSSITVKMTFGPGDLLKKLDISKPEWGCV